MTADRDEWLALTAEQAIETELPICDPHHHLWDYPGSRYLVDEFRADFGGGHRVEETVFVECRQFYHADGPIEMRPVGEKGGKPATLQSLERRAERYVADSVSPATKRSSASRTSAPATGCRRFSKHTSPPAAAFAGSATQRPGTQAIASTTRTPIRRRD